MRALPLLFLLAACVGDETLTKYGAEGTWRLAELNGTAFEAPATITFAQGGPVNGAASCNAYHTTQTAPYPWIELGPIAATKRACPNLKKEQRYFTLLRSMNLVEVSGDVLILSNDAGDTMLFSRATAE